MSLDTSSTPSTVVFRVCTPPPLAQRISSDKKRREVYIGKHAFSTPKEPKEAMNNSEVAVMKTRELIDNIAEIFNDWRGSARDK